MSEPPPKNYPKALLIWGVMTAAMIVFVAQGLVAGKIPSGKSTSVRFANSPDRFNAQIGLWMLIAAAMAVAWFVLLLLMLKERRDRLDRETEENRRSDDQA